MRVGVLGGGITGAVIAKRLAEQGHEVLLYEAGPEIGGLVASHTVGGTDLEIYYHHIFTHETSIIDLITELGVDKDLDWIDSSVSVLSADGVLRSFSTPKDILVFRPIPFFSRIRMGAAGVLAPYLFRWQQLDHTPAVTWARKLMGKKAAEEIWDPMLRAKWGELHTEVPAPWLWARMRQRSRSRGKGKEKLGYIRGGFRKLYLALQNDLEAKGVKLHFDQPVQRVLTDGIKVHGVQTSAGIEELDHVVSTIPIPRLTSLLDEKVPASYRERLAQTEYMWVICVILTLDRQLTPYYWVNVADRSIPFGAFIEHTNLIPPSDYDGNHVVYLGRYFPPARYGEEAERLAQGNLNEIVGEWIEHLSRFNPDFDPTWIKKVIPFRTQFAAPVVRAGQGNRILPFATPVDGLWVATMTQIYPDDRGQSEGIHLAERCVQAMEPRLLP